ncbi:MAG: hypothetical protein KAH99_01690 [Verrucomicrobia bacterium]|nr:hypothetical protein [Verrucomicrobiota bacterium]
MKTRWNVSVFAAVIIGSTIPAKADIVWPADGDWTALMVGATLYFDAKGDQRPSPIDLIGTTDTFAAGYWACIENGHITGGITNDALMFRMRVGGESGNYVWQAHLDTDGDASNVEWILQLVQSGGPSSQGVELIKTAIGGTTLSDIDIGSNSSSWLGDLNLNSRWTAISGSTDFHVDFAIPWNEFTTITGVTEIEQIRTVLSTSTTHAGINKDAPLGAALTDQISDVLSERIPEPAVITLLLGTGGGMLAFRRIFKHEPEDDVQPRV